MTSGLRMRRQIGDAMRVDPNLALLQPVADEQVLDDGHHLLAAQAIEAVPPALEVEEPLLLGVDVGEEIGVLVPDGRFGLEALEVLREPGTVEATSSPGPRGSASATRRPRTRRRRASD